MKKLAAILVLTILFAHFAGYYVYFMVRMGQIRTEMRREISRLPLTHFTRFALSEEEFQKVRVSDHEIKVDGKMYDIARREIQDNKVIVYARHDAAEDDLLAFFNEVFTRSWNDARTTPASLTNFMTLSFIIEPLLALRVESLQQFHNTTILLYFHTIPLALEPPPPKC